MANVLIGVDLGGTRIRTGRFDEELHMQARHETLTLASQGLESTLGRIKDAVRAVWPQDGADVLGIGVSAPGPLDPRTGVIVAPPNLPGWHNVALGKLLHEAFDVPVYVGNDANVAALAEAVRGAARGYRHVVYLTVSTGVGGGIVVDGRLLLGSGGLAAEAGHMIMVADAGRSSSLENETAGPALARKVVARIQAGESSVVTDMVEGDLARVDGRVVGQAALQGDALALDVVRDAGRIVGLGIVTLLHLFNPEIVLVGGGVTNVGELLFAPMRQAIEEASLDAAYWQELVLGSPALGEDVSLIGAAVLVATRGGQEDISAVSASLGVQDS